MDEIPEMLSDREREVLADLEAQFATPLREQPTESLEAQLRASAGRRPPVEARVIRPARTDNGGGGFPPIDPPEKRYGGRPGRGSGGSGDIPRSVALLLIWIAVGAAWVVDSPEQRGADLPFLLLVLVGGSLGALLLPGGGRSGRR